MSGKWSGAIRIDLPMSRSCSCRAIDGYRASSRRRIGDLEPRAPVDDHVHAAIRQRAPPRPGVGCWGRDGRTACLVQLKVASAIGPAHGMRVSVQVESCQLGP